MTTSLVCELCIHIVIIIIIIIVIIIIIIDYCWFQKFLLYLQIMTVEWNAILLYNIMQDINLKLLMFTIMDRASYS